MLFPPLNGPLSHDEFIDLCILLGCDYCDSIRGIGPKRAIELIQKHRTIESIIKHIDSKKYPIPENWAFEQARVLFKTPEVSDPTSVEIKWTGPDEVGLVEFLVEKKGFQEDRVKNGIKKLQAAKQTSTQGRLDSFFKVIPSTTPVKRKADEGKKKGGKGPAGKRGKGAGFKRPK